MDFRKEKDMIDFCYRSEMLAVVISRQPNQPVTTGLFLPINIPLLQNSVWCTVTKAEDTIQTPYQSGSLENDALFRLKATHASCCQKRQRILTTFPFQVASGVIRVSRPLKCPYDLACKGAYGGLSGVILRRTPRGLESGARLGASLRPDPPA